MNLIDPTGLLVDVVYHRSTGELSVVDMTTGQSLLIHAHSGDNPFPGDTSLGPIPTGKYDILSGPGNRFGNTYRLDKSDGTRDDLDGVGGRSGRYRLHRGRFTNGCINVKDDKSWSSADSIIQSTTTFTVPDFYKGDGIRCAFGRCDAHGEPITYFGTLWVID